MSWEMQIHMEKKGWVSIQESSLPEPYRYERKEQAERMINICYPVLESERKRVIEVDYPPNSDY